MVWFFNETILPQKDDKGINLNAIKKFVLLVCSMTSELNNIIITNNTNETLKNEAKDIIFKYPINIITSLMKNNSIQLETQKTLDKGTLSKAFDAFYNVYSVKKEKDGAFENAIVLFSDETLMQKLQVVRYRFYCLRALIQKHPEEYKQFLQSNLDDANNVISQAINICIERSYWDLISSNDFLCFINKVTGSEENNKKIGLNAVDKFMQLICSIMNGKNKNQTSNIVVDSMDIITNIVGNIYFAWNDIIKDDNEQKMLERIFVSAINILKSVSEYDNVNMDGILKNKDLILWLYLIYKKIHFDSDFFRTLQANGKQLSLRDTPHFLKEYKILDGDDKISEKNIFYSDDRTKEFINYIKEISRLNLIPLVDVLPKVLEKKQEAQQKLVEWFHKDKIRRVSKSIESIPNKLFDLALYGRDSLSVFSAVKTLYQMKRYDHLQKLLLSEDYNSDIVRKLSLSLTEESYSEVLTIDEFPLNDVQKSLAEGIGIVIKLLLEKNVD